MKKVSLLLVIAIVYFTNTKIYAQSNTHNARFNHLAIYVTDLNRSGEFYKNVIGLDTIPEPFHDGKHLWLKVGPVSSLHIIEGADKPKEYFKANHLCFSVNSMDVFIAALNKKEIGFEDFTGSKNNKITTRPDGVKQIWLQDPDGYWIEINDARQ